MRFVRLAAFLLVAAASVYQTLELRDLWTHYHFALVSLDEAVFVGQQCESTVAQCCK